MRRAPALMTALVVLAAGAACGEDDAPAEDQLPETIQITIEEGTASPLGQQVDVALGQEVELVVKADTTGSIHVHSDPEQEFTYEPGTNAFEVMIDRPGVVDVEAHEPAQLLVQLEVR